MVRRRRIAGAGRSMTDRTALILGTVLVGLVAADLALGTGAVLFVARRLVGLVDWLIFWR
jgi:hypothetical protein